MALSARWLGRADADLIGTVRMHCYGAGMNSMQQFVNSVHDDPRAADGEFLVVERDGRAVGTATGHHLTMHTHGATFPCHGVAYVGAIRTQRRKKSDGESGVATHVMQETIRRGRERGDVISALMPFRASFYEHFGYGLVERQANWTIPLSIIPGADHAFRPFEERMLPALVATRNAIAQRGNCDIERSEAFWRLMIKRAEPGFLFVDEPSAGEVRGWVFLMTDADGTARVTDWGASSPAGFRRVLGFLGALRDQYAKALITCPIDLPVNRLLKESQVPHRPVTHATALQSVISRMQIRILDHKRYLEGIQWPADVRGETTVAIREVEGEVSRLKLTVDGGRCAVTSGPATAAMTLADKDWASVVTGEISATEAVRWGLAEGSPEAAALLDALARGPKPFTHEYF